MDTRFRLLLMIMMLTALFFGFLHLFVPGKTLYNFERLHIFLFNLCSGGTILMHFSENRKKISKKTVFFFVFSIVYAIFAFAELFLPAVFVSFVLALVVESVRVERFSFFPYNFFIKNAKVSEKFHQASLLCLSMGLVISGMVILNNKFLHIVSFPKLKMDTFFLGFSFPLSLITMSVIFSFMKTDVSRLVIRLKNIGFWNVNLGVIIFFIFIMFEKLIPQLVVTTILFLSVLLIYFLYKDLGSDLQEKNFLTSGMFFLLYTAITGIIYIALEFSSYYNPEKFKILMRMHSFASLYGWNLSGLAVICRSNDFPIRLDSKYVISLHWVTAIFLAPMGTYYRTFAIISLLCYGLILYTILFSRASDKLSGGKMKGSDPLVGRQDEA